MNYEKPFFSGAQHPSTIIYLCVNGIFFWASVVHPDEFVRSMVPQCRR
jgi:hypothetical protein